MDEDRNGEDGMEVGEASARMPPKMRKGWIRKTVALVKNKKDADEGVAKGTEKAKGVTEMDVDMNGALNPSSGLGIRRLTKILNVQYHQHQQRRRAVWPLLQLLTILLPALL